ncbi:MAG: nucleotide pyrophosphohydrolase [Candidatus Thorarchaeota archaeon]|nr:nucleotide pyrophosphohydrolase [Candidatus Thorarchaeota archaeon]
MSDEGYSLEELMALIRKFVQDRDWEDFQKPSALAVSASIEMGELLERFQWLSHKEIADLLKDDRYRESIADEIADVIVYMLRIADTTGIEPTSAILRKLKKNEEKYPVDVWRGKIPDKIRKKKLMTR